MRKNTKIIALILTLALALTGVFAVASFADEEEKLPVSGEITLAPNGASAIVSMTFDDGKLETSKLLNQLCREYGLKASIMMITDRIDSSSTLSAETWLDIFDDGYLAPESHSSDHKNLYQKNEDGTYKYDVTDELLKAEIPGSLATLNEKFPDYDVLTFAIPNSNYQARERAYLQESFYASRGGACVVIPAYGNVGNMMTLDPAYGTAINSWYHPSIIRFHANSAPSSVTVNDIIQYLNKCVENNGWFISLCHGVSEGSTPDMTEEQMREIFAVMSSYQNSGKLWVATYTEATKYIRERQGANLTVAQSGDGYVVNIKLNDYTGDGLPLGLATAKNSDGSTRNVFDMPLTVKLEVPSTWSKVMYSLEGEPKLARTFNESGKTYAYVNVVPNATDVEVSDASYMEDLDFVIGSAQTPANAWRPTTAYNGILYGVWASEEDYLTGKAPTYWYQNVDNTKTEKVKNDPKNPIGIYADKITNANICMTGYNTYCPEYTAEGFVPGFVRLYQDVTSGSAFLTDADVQYVIDLGGNELTISHQFTVGEQQGDNHKKTSFTIKNGRWHYKSNSFYLRPDSSVLFYNVDMTVDGGKINSDGGFELWVIDTCKITLTNPATQFVCTFNYLAPYQSYLVFKNTELVQTATPTKPLFSIVSSYGISNFSILFDKDSSVSRNSNNWVELNETTGPNIMSCKQGLYFELGCEISKAAMPDSYNFEYSYTKRVVEKVDEDGKVTYSTEPTTAVANTDGGWLEFAVVKPSEEGISYTLNTDTAIATLSGTFIYDNTNTSKKEPAFSKDAFNSNENFIPDGEWLVAHLNAGKGTLSIKSETIWKPSAATPGITYAVWATEEDYLTGEAPAKWYTGDFTTENMGALNNKCNTFADPNFIPGYARLYADVTAPTIIYMGEKQKLTVDLNGFTLNKSGFLVGGAGSSAEASLTIKNGNWNYYAGQNFVRANATFILENVHWTVSHGNTGLTANNFFYTFGADYARFTNCVITAKHGYLFKFNYQGSAGAARSTVIFENTDIIYEEVPENGVFVLSESNYGTCAYDITFDKDSSISGIGDAPWVVMYEGFNYNKNTETGTVETFTNNVITFEDGFSAGEGVTYPTTYKFYATNVAETTEAWKTALAAGKSSANTVYLDVATPSVNDTRLTVNAPEGAPAALHTHTAAEAVVENMRETTCYLMGAYQNVVYCSDCGMVISRQTVTTPVLAHTPLDAVVENDVKVTCTANGSYDTVVYCGVCNYEISRVTTIISAPGHDFDINYKCTVCELVANIWTPTKEGNTKDYTGITYGVWASEDDFINGNEPVRFSTSNILETALIGATDLSGGVTYQDNFMAGYVHLYADVKNTSDIIVGRLQKLVINLDSKTWTQDYRLQIGGPSGVSLPNSYLTVKNGNWVSNAQLQARIDTNVILDNVVMTKNNGSELFFEYGAGYVRFTDCTLNVATSVFWFNQKNVKRTQLIFENTDLVYSGKPNGAIFQFNNVDNAIDIYFDKNSSIKSDSGTWYSVKSGNTLNDGAVNFNFEEGFKLYEGMDIPSVSEEHTGKIALNGIEGINYVMCAYKIFGANGQLVAKSYDAYLEGNPNNKYIIDFVPNGGKIVFYTDIVVGEIHTYLNWSLTFDLNGHKLTFNKAGNIQLGHSQSGGWNERVITFTSSGDRGILDATIKTGNTFQARPGTITRFENLDIIFGGNGYNDGGGKEISFKDCTVTGLKSGAYLSGQDGFGAGAGNARNITFDNTTLTNMLIHTSKLSNKDNLTINFKNNSVIDNYGDMIVVYPSERKETLGVSGDRNYFFNIEKGTTFTHFDNYSLNLILLTKGCENCTVTENTDYAIRKVDDKYVIGERASVPSGAFTTNLTLYSDFTLNFFANPEYVTNVIYRTEALANEEWNGKTQYILEGITPETAADTMYFVVEVVEGDTVCYMPLGYSVLKYANAIVDGEKYTAIEKQFVSAVMAYVQAAYTYVGKTAPAFEGVAYETAAAETPKEFSHSAIKGVQLALGTEIGVRFNIVEGYSGTLTVGDSTYEITGGFVVENVDYVVVNLRAYEFFNAGIEVSDESGAAVYEMAHYVAYATAEGGNVETLVTALYDYSYLANEYKRVKK